MKKLSYWAKAHPVSARIIIAICHVLVIPNAICLGILLFLFDCGDTRWLLVIIANLFFILFILYPDKLSNSGVFRYSYARQKFHDFGLVVCGSLVLALGVNNFFTQGHNDRSFAQQPKAEFIVYQTQNKDHEKEKPRIKQRLKQLKKQIRQEVHIIKKTLKKQDRNGQSTAVKILLTLLTVAVALFLGYVVAALGCSLACSGADALALVVWLLGWGGIIWLGVIVIKRIWAKHGNPKEGT